MTYSVSASSPWGMPSRNWWGGRCSGNGRRSWGLCLRVGVWSPWRPCLPRWPSFDTKVAIVDQVPANALAPAPDEIPATDGESAPS